MSACKLYTWPLPSRSRRTAGPPTPGLGTSSVTSAVAGASGEGWAFGGRPSARRHRKDVLVLVPSQPPRQDSASGPPHREGASRPAPRSSAVLGRVPRLGPVPDRGCALPSGPRTWATTSSAHARAPFPAGLQSGPVLSPQPPAHRRGPGDCRGRCHLGLRGLPRRCPLRRGPGRELQPSRGPGPPVLLLAAPACASPVRAASGSVRDTAAVTRAAALEDSGPRLTSRVLRPRRGLLEGRHCDLLVPCVLR